MSTSKQHAILKQYIELFVGEGDKQLCTPYGLKHKAEKFADYFIGQKIYFTEESASAVLKEIGLIVDEEGYIRGEWEYPGLDTLVRSIGNGDFEKRFAIKKYHTPFYKIPSLRVAGMIEAYSGAHERTGNNDFPIFDSFMYDEMQWIEIDDGVLAYFFKHGTIVFDTIYVKAKRKGTASKLFKLFLDEVAKLDEEFIIEIDAYTDDSKIFFKSMSQKYGFFKPSSRLMKPDVYSICVADIKLQGEQI